MGISSVVLVACLLGCALASSNSTYGSSYVINCDTINSNLLRNLPRNITKLIVKKPQNSAITIFNNKCARVIKKIASRNTLYELEFNGYKYIQPQLRDILVYTPELKKMALKTPDIKKIDLEILNLTPKLNSLDLDSNDELTHIFGETNANITFLSARNTPLLEKIDYNTNSRELYLKLNNSGFRCDAVNAILISNLNVKMAQLRK